MLPRLPVPKPKELTAYFSFHQRIDLCATIKSLRTNKSMRLGATSYIHQFGVGLAVVGSLTAISTRTSRGGRTKDW